MKKAEEIWIEHRTLVELIEPVAVVGSPGLRSVGKLAVDNLIAQTKAVLLAELYSTHMPTIYQTTPSYAAHPSLPGMGGAIVEASSPDLPKVQFYYCQNPPLVFARGYHPNFAGQYNVAEKVIEFLSEMQVKRMIVVAGYGSKDKKICCAANSQSLLDEMKQKFDVGLGYKGPFMGFSGLVFGLAQLKNIEALCLFASTEPVEDNLEFPDKEASDRAVEKLKQILAIN